MPRRQAQLEIMPSCKPVKIVAWCTQEQGSQAICYANMSRCLMKGTEQTISSMQVEGYLSLSILSCLRGKSRPRNPEGTSVGRKSGSFQLLSTPFSALYSHHKALPEFAGLGFCWARRTGFHQTTPQPQTNTALLIKPFRAALRDRGGILRIF